jgi:hypothetical protein
MVRTFLATVILFALAFVAQPALAQAPPAAAPQNPSPTSALPCGETPGGKTLLFVCPVPPFLTEDDTDDSEANDSGVRIMLKLSEGTALRIAIDQRTRISHVGEPIHGHVVAAVYAFDEPVIPAGTIATGHVTSIVPVSTLHRMEAYANGDFSPFHRYEVTFDQLTLPDGRTLDIDTTVAPGAAEVVHLVSKPQTQGSNEEDEAETPTASTPQADNTPHGKMHWLKQFLVEQSPYRRQFIEVGTHFSVSLNQELDFGSETQTEGQLAQLGTLPVADSVLHARLLLEVSSATATRGTPVIAELTRPVYSPDHQLLLPCGSRLIGQVVEARPARSLHRNGELRVIFEHIEMPGGNLQEVQGTLEGIEVDRAAHMKLDEEGGARATDTKTRYLTTGMAIAMAAVAAHPDVDRGNLDESTQDPAAVRAGSGYSGFGLAGTLIGLAARSNAVSIAFSAYGASASIYSNFLSRGREVVLPKNAPVEIGLGTSHSGGVKH